MRICPSHRAPWRALSLVAALSLAVFPGPSGATPAREAPAVPDEDTPHANAVARVGGCSGTLIAPDIVLTAAHCVPTGLREVPAAPDTCPRLRGQAGLAAFPGEDPARWYPAGFALPVIFGPGGKPPVATRGTLEYALPRCADVGLFRLDAPVPPEVAVPLPVVTRAASGSAFDRALSRGPLRHSGFGRPQGEDAQDALRRTGPVIYWTRTDCALVALPPMRSHGRRIATGDSGAPLLLGLADGGEAVLGVIWGRNPPDGAACGPPLPFPPEDHGAYTATLRGPVPGTEATDIGAWLDSMVPGSTIALP